MNDMIGNALERKTISDQYHSSAYPQFLRSNGPFKVYNHAEHKGSIENIHKINQQADQRFHQEMNQIKSVKEFEKNQFQMTKFKQDILANHS